MKITIIAANGVPIEGEAHEWLCALITVLSESQRQQLLENMKNRITLAAAKQNGHVIRVPGIASQEGFGRF
jgi:hypothetical protein